MIGTVLIVVLVLAIGARAGDTRRLRQQEVILAKLPRDDAASYFKVLRRRAWKVRLLRGLALVSLVVILYARNRTWQIKAASDGRSGVSALPSQRGGQSNSSGIATEAAR